MSEKGRLDRGRVEENRERARQREGERERGREREREIFTRKIIEWCSVMVNAIVGSRSIDDRIGKKIVCRVTWRVVNPSGTTRKGEGRGKRTRRALVCRIPANRTVRSCVILDCVEVGRDHRSIRMEQGNEGGLERVISKVHIYMVERTNSFVWSIVL